MDVDIPFACDLSKLSSDQRERERFLLGQLKGSLVRSEESARGWRIHVPATQQSLRDLGELLALERLCCPFLDFRIEVGPAEHAVVEIGGRDGAKPFIAAEFMP